MAWDDCLHLATHLSHVDELDEDLCPELRGGTAENHQLYPLGDAIAQGNGPLHGGVLLHAAIYKVILIIRELEGKKTTIRYSWSSEGHISSAQWWLGTSMGKQVCGYLPGICVPKPKRVMCGSSHQDLSR